jgi:hypothetical protein
MIEPNSELVIDYELVRNNIQIIKGKLPLIAKSWVLLRAMHMDMIFRWLLRH